MIFLRGRTDGNVLHFPAEYDLALPRAAAEGKACPLVLLLHDLGFGREQWVHSVRLEKLTEETGMAFLMPEGRRSCFLNMSAGPRWNDFLLENLIPEVQRQTCVGGQAPAVIGVGSGALGALQLAAKASLFCAVIDPDFTSPFRRDRERWPRQEEWEGVFADRMEDWQSERFSAVSGATVGQEETAHSFLKAFGLKGWRVIPRTDADLEQKLICGLECCAPAEWKHRGVEYGGQA